jgi:TonB-linked SusC/RagA family outer membrane protein
MRKKLLLILSAMLLLFAQLNAQSTVTVTGTITDQQDGKPLSGVTIKAKGSNAATSTNAEGQFKIVVPKSVSILEISYVGYRDMAVHITGQHLTIKMAEADKSLNEIVVVGYGTKLKKDVLGSVSTVTAKEMANTPATSFESAIQGRAAGVYVSQQNGKLGQAINVKIRGASSVSAGNEPLYVVDGIPITTTDLSSTSAATNALADLNMNDIESIQILKDASSTAIYGASASNGVVLITTKKGKMGTSRIDFNYYTGNQEPTGKRQFLNAKQYVDYFTQAALGAANQDYLAGYYSTLQAAQQDYLNYVNSRFTRYSAGNNDWQTAKVNTNWQDLAFQNAPISEYDLNISGGDAKTKFYVSGQYLDQTGILVRNAYKRYSGRANLEHKVKDWLTAGINLAFARSLNSRVSNDNAFSTPLQIVALSPITPLIDPRTGLISGALDPNTGAPNTNYPVYYNPLLSVIDGFYNTLVNRTFGTFYATANLMKGLNFHTDFGVDQLNQFEENYYGRLTARNIGVPNGSGFYGTTQVLNLTTNNYFNYHANFKQKHDLDVILGMSYTDRTYDFSSAAGEQFPSDAYKKLSSAASKTDASSSSTSSTLISYFSRVNYKFNNKYLLSVTGRYDGSSRFGVNNRYGLFLGASAGWVLTEEDFLKDVKWLSFLKLKAGYAGNGNDRIPDFAARGLYSGNAPYGGQPGQHPTQIANPDLKWETTYGTDIGIEASLFNNRVSVEIDYYSRDTRDLLLNQEVPGTSGFATQLRNIGRLKNTGIEFTINTTNISTKNFRWTTSLNFGANKNVVTNLGGQLLGTGVNKAMEGQPLGVFVAREFAGADPNNGDALYVKNTVKQDGSLDKTTTNDYNEAADVVIGSPIPKFIYGFGNTFTFKGFDVDVLLQGVYGNKIYNGGGQYMSASGSNGFDNQTVDQLAAWKQPGDKTMVPEARLFYANGTDPSSRYISDGSYLRVKAVTIGYNLPAQLIRKIKLERLRVYVRAQNLFTITKYKGWDPEVTADFLASNINQGIDFYSAPQLKTLVFGVNIGL